MYLYFNNQGVLKEIINDDAIRQGNSNINKIRFFIEGAEPQIVNNVYKAITFITGVRTFIDVNGNQLTTESISLSTEELQIPYNKKRELKFFKYFTKYEMFSITVPDDILNESGTVGCRVQMVSAEGIITLGLIVFNVEITTGGQAIIEPDTAINIAQWNYLISNMLTPEKYVVKYNADANEWDVVPTEGSTKPVTSGGVATAIANALSSVYKLQGSAEVSYLENLDKAETLNGYVYNLSDEGTLTNEDGTTISVREGDNIVFVWHDGEWYWDKIGSSIDTSDLATKSGNNTFSGTNTFKNVFYVTTSNEVSGLSYGLRIRNNGWTSDIQQEGGANLQFGGAKIVSNVSFVPSNDNQKDLGETSYQWHDIHIAGSIRNGGYTSLQLAPYGFRTYNMWALGDTAVIGNSSTPFATEYVKNINVGKADTAGQGIITFVNPDLSNQGNWYITSPDQNSIEIKQDTQNTGIKISRGSVVPLTTNYFTLGSDSLKWKKIYVEANGIDFGNNAWVQKDGSNRIIITNNGVTKVKVGANETYFANHVEPDANNTYDLGRAGVKWKTAYVRYLNDDSVNIAVSDIAQKGSSQAFTGTFDANGEFEVTFTGEDYLKPGMYMVTYANAQAFIYIDSTLVMLASLGNPIRTSMPVVYNSQYGYTVPGMLRIDVLDTTTVGADTRATRIRVKVSNGTQNAASTLQCSFYLTKLA